MYFESDLGCHQVACLPGRLECISKRYTDSDFFAIVLLFFIIDIIYVNCPVFQYQSCCSLESSI